MVSIICDNTHGVNFNTPVFAVYSNAASNGPRTSMQEKKGADEIGISHSLQILNDDGVFADHDTQGFSETLTALPLTTLVEL